MVSSSTLPKIPNHYFSQRAYIKSDPSTGLLASRQGNRLIAIPDMLLRNIHRSLRQEAGDATPLALYTCGYWWGGYFYDRISQELERYYQMPLAEINAMEFLVTLRELWSVHGLGYLNLDFSYRNYGLIKVLTAYSVLQEGSDIGLKPGQLPSYHLEAGFLAAWFSRWAGKELRACATDWGHRHLSEETATELAPFTEFLIGMSDRIEPIENQVRQGDRTGVILQKIAMESSVP